MIGAESTTQDVIDQASRRLMTTYRRAPIVVVRGQGCELFDADGQRYLDLVAGVGVNALGYAHPLLIDAWTDQMRRAVHVSNLYHDALQGQVAEKLAQLTGLDRAFFSNSGAEAIEGSLKLARRFFSSSGNPRSDVVALKGAFHGRTLGALSATWDAHYRAPYEPLVPRFAFADPADPSSLEPLVSERTAAVILEPIQGEGGVRPVPAAFVQEVARLRSRLGFLVIADEVQCGLGRTGWVSYCAAIGLKPDIVAFGKALGGGLPMGATVAAEPVATAFQPGDHGSTFGGNLMACRAALVLLDLLAEGALIDHVRAVGARLKRGLQALVRRHEIAREVRGDGLMLAVELSVPARPLAEAARDDGMLINATAETVLRFLPPLVLSEVEVDEALERLEVVLGRAAHV